MTEAYSGPYRIYDAFRIYGEVSFAKMVNAKQKNFDRVNTPLHSLHEITNKPKPTANFKSQFKL